MESTSSRTSGWTLFAAVMLIVAGGMNVFNGIIALSKDEFLRNQLLFSSLTFWGWVFLIFGALQLLAGFLVLAGRMAGGWLGTALAAVAAMVWFLFLFAFPFGALIGILVNIAIIYGLTIHSFEESA